MYYPGIYTMFISTRTQPTHAILTCLRKGTKVNTAVVVCTRTLSLVSEGRQSIIAKMESSFEP